MVKDFLDFAGSQLPGVDIDELERRTDRYVAEIGGQRIHMTDPWAFSGRVLRLDFSKPSPRSTELYEIPAAFFSSTHSKQEARQSSDFVEMPTVRGTRFQVSLETSPHTVWRIYCGNDLTGELRNPSSEPGLAQSADGAWLLRTLGRWGWQLFADDLATHNTAARYANDRLRRGGNLRIGDGLSYLVKQRQVKRANWVVSTETAPIADFRSDAASTGTRIEITTQAAANEVTMFSLVLLLTASVILIEDEGAGAAADVGAQGQWASLP